MLTLYSIIIDPDAEIPNSYILVITDAENAIDTPLTSEGYFIVIERIELAKNAIELTDIEVSEHFVIPNEETLSINIAEVSYMIQEGENDDSAAVLHFLNIMFDIVNASPFFLPADHKKALYSLATHVTYSKDIQSFFLESGYTREAIMNGILWLIGAFFANMKIIR